jgi:non-ribosomal peptide synthetase-like protein
MSTTLPGPGPLQEAAAPAAPARSLLDVFAATLAVHGARLAIDAPDARLTYGELWEGAGRLAGDLAARGVGPGDRVGVRIPGGTARLYTTILGVLRSGAAYVPVDADDPPARASAAWEASGACAVVSEGAELAVIADPRGGAGAPSPSDDAWVIFTSGSTGAPKGVAVTHRSAAAFVDAEAGLWSVSPGDRVLAGLSVGFDASCEEIWLAWRHGAALVPAPRSVMRSGADLGPWLRERSVSVVSTVPTLASMWDEETLAGVRLLVLGGEACPDELGWRLASGREVWNTYGPTEATVVSTAARVVPGESITIGRALAGWATAVLDESGRAVAPGQEGELAIAGVGLGRYLDRELDARRYAPLPDRGWERAYRTGDIVRETPAGLHFVGRRDDQVKVGGRRVELGEVAAALRAVAGVEAAAVVVRRTEAGNAVLAGYVSGPRPAHEVRAEVAERLPAAMVPLVVALPALPLASSGKVDRKALPWPPPAVAPPADGSPTGLAGWLAERWVEQLGPQALTVDSDFFDLGGSSVAAAMLVSRLRARFPAVAVADVYHHRRLGELAVRLEALGEGGGGRPAERRTRPGRRFGLAQVGGVLGLLAAAGPAWIIGLLALDDAVGSGPRAPWPVLLGAWLVLATSPCHAVILAGARWALLRDLRPGRHPRRGSLAWRLWFVDRLADALHLERLAGTPWSPVAARLMGATVGAGARLGTLPSPTALCTIGAGATLESSVDAHGWWVEGDELVVGELRIGAGARVGTRTVLMPGADIGEGAEVEPGSVVSGRVPAGERWAGSPARRVGHAGASWPAEPPPRPRRGLWPALYTLGSLGISVSSLIAAIPSLALLWAVGALSGSLSAMALSVVIWSPLVALLFVVTDALEHALVFRLAVRALRPGWHPDYGAVGFALWFSGQLDEATQAILFPLYATVYTRPWLRLHGLTVGRRTEVSTTEGLSPLVSLGAGSMVADHPMFAAARSHRGWIHLAPVAVGDRTFIGNGALLEAGTRVGDDCLIGIESNAPRDAPDGTTWFGAPALELPRVPDRPDPARTMFPSRRLVLARATTEVVRILLPTTVTLVLGALMLSGLEATVRAGGVPALAAVVVPVELAGALCAVLVTIAVKWLVIGRYRRGETPLWSSLVWRDEIVNSCQEQLAGEWLLEAAQGTPLVPAYLRAMGARVGRDVWCDTLAITEFDVVTIGDGCAINRGACVETHLFHDRLLRIGPAVLEEGATLGPVSAVLPDTRLGAGCVVGGRSVVLRGEELPPGTRWHGSPVVAA